MTACLLCLCLTAAQAPPPPGNVPPAPTPSVSPVVPRPLTLEEFGATFQPVPGTYEVLFLHPCSKKPVTVTFTLPPGNPKMKIDKREIEFDYGKFEVRLRFRIFGRVAVVTE
jgi:hypothetical protein